jgi:hypothetical protein
MKRRWQLIPLALILVVGCLWYFNRKNATHESKNVRSDPRDGLVTRDSSSGRKIEPQPPVDEIQIPPHWRGLAKLMSPTTATSDEWKSISVQGGTMDNSGAPVAYGIALNILPLLEADKNINARHVQLSISRNSEGGIVSSIWGHKTRKVLALDWSKGSVTQNPRPMGTIPLEGQIDDAPPGEKYQNASLIGFTTSNRDKRRKVIGISPKGEKLIEIPYDYSGFKALPSFVSAKYPIAAMPKQSEDSHEFVSVLIIDYKKGVLIGEAELPKDARSTRPVFYLDKENDILVCTGYDLKWMMIVDLQSYVKR